MPCALMPSMAEAGRRPPPSSPAPVCSMVWSWTDYGWNTMNLFACKVSYPTEVTRKICSRCTLDRPALMLMLITTSLISCVGRSNPVSLPVVVLRYARLALLPKLSIHIRSHDCAILNLLHLPWRLFMSANALTRHS